METKKEIRVIVVGDFLIFRTGLKLLLENEKTLKFVGEAANLMEVAHLINKVKPDLLLVESSEVDNGHFSRFVSSQINYTPMIVLTNSRNMENHQKYLLLGVDGLVSKEQTEDILFKAIKQVSRGEVWFDRRLLGETIKQLVKEKKSLPENLYSYKCAVLTEREKEVLTLICQGMKNKMIADSLFITETTVRHHLTSIFGKLKVKSRLELIVYAFKERLVEVPNESFVSA